MSILMFLIDVFIFIILKRTCILKIVYLWWNRYTLFWRGSKKSKWFSFIILLYIPSRGIRRMQYYTLRSSVGHDSWPIVRKWPSCVLNLVCIFIYFILLYFSSFLAEQNGQGARKYRRENAWQVTYPLQSVLHFSAAHWYSFLCACAIKINKTRYAQSNFRVFPYCFELE